MPRYPRRIVVLRTGARRASGLGGRQFRKEAAGGVRPEGRRAGGPEGKPRPVCGTGGHRREVGRRGEEAAAAYLAARGYTILARNYRCRWGEIDIVARQGSTVVFVEVKTRTQGAYGLPEESVDGRKKARLRRLAGHYLRVGGLDGADCRFEVVAVELDRQGQVRRLEVFVDAFC